MIWYLASLANAPILSGKLVIHGIGIAREYVTGRRIQKNLNEILTIPLIVVIV